MRDDREDWAERLYARVPEIYRTRDLEQGQPLLQVVRAIAGQVSSVRVDMDSLWDDFFIETCADWVVPYLGQLVGTRLLANPIGQSNRLDVRNTVLWRRSRGTPAMLADLERATTGQRGEFAEFFHNLAWVQNLRHLQPQRSFVAATHDPALLDLLGGGSDPFGHVIDIRPSADRESGALVSDPFAPGHGQLGVARPATGTPGRYQVRKVGFFLRRLLTFATFGVTPAPATGSITTYQFDPLGREMPLFAQATGKPITRAGLGVAPSRYFGPGLDIAVRRAGVPLAMAAGDPPAFTNSTEPFTFGTTSPVGLDPVRGMRVVDRRVFPSGSEHFLVTAIWRTAGGDVSLGELHTLEVRLGLDAAAFQVQPASALAGRLVLRLETGPSSAARMRPAAGAGRFPACVIAVRDDVSVPRAALAQGNQPGAFSAYQDALYVYLPEVVLYPGDQVDLHVADDGSTYFQGGLDRTHLARVSEGQVWPAADLTRSSSVPAQVGLHRRRGLFCVDEGRFGDAMLIEAFAFTGVAQRLGAIATAEIGFGSLPLELRRDLEIPLPQTTWTAFDFLPTDSAVRDRIPSPSRLLLRVSPLNAGGAVQVCPQLELIVTNRGGDSMLVYLPEISFVPGQDPPWFFVAEDGSTYSAQAFEGSVRDFDQPDQLPESALARVSAGQVTPIEGEYPLRRRLVTAGARQAGAVYIDPERGGFCLPDGDPLLTLGRDLALSVDYVEAFPDRVGARAYDRQIDYSTSPPTRIVSALGDSDRALPFWRIHRTLGDALAMAEDGDVIEIADSATYPGSLDLMMAGKKRLFIRAANQPRFERPCLVLDGADPAFNIMAGSDTQASLELNGILIGGGRLQVTGDLGRLELVSCTLDPDSGGQIRSSGGQAGDLTSWLVCRCLTGPLRLGPGVRQVTLADSIVHRPGGLAVGGPSEGADIASDEPAGSLQLERTTVLGRIRAYDLQASDSLLNELSKIDDRQFGCIRFSRYEPGSSLPRRYRCVPTDQDLQLTPPDTASLVFRSLRPGSPTYAMPAIGSSSHALGASESGDEVGAFAHAYPGLRVANLHAKLNQFLPVGLEPVVIADA